MSKIFNPKPKIEQIKELEELLLTTPMSQYEFHKTITEMNFLTRRMLAYSVPKGSENEIQNCNNITE